MGLPQRSTSIPRRLGPYELIRPLGRGGMGTVYLARDPKADRRVAVKTVEADAGDGGQAIKRFIKEVEILSRLEHPNIVRALGPLERDGDTWFFAMEYVEGKTLAAILREVGRLDAGQATFFLCEVLRALEAAHAQGVLHRDLKPSNVLVDRARRVMLSDFGIARAVDLTRLTTSSMALGTPAYMAPEQISGKDADERSDLYSLGVMGYEMVTGRLPFVAENPYAVLKMHQDQLPKHPREAFADIPERIEAAILRAMAKAPADRFASAEEFRLALAESDSREELIRSTGAWLDTLVHQETVALDAPRRQGKLPFLVVAALLAVAGGIAWKVSTHRTTVPIPSPPATARRVEVMRSDKVAVRGVIEKLDPVSGTLTIRDEKGVSQTLTRWQYTELKYVDR